MVALFLTGIYPTLQERIITKVFDLICLKSIPVRMEELLPPPADVSIYGGTHSNLSEYQGPPG